MRTILAMIALAWALAAAHAADIHLLPVQLDGIKTIALFGQIDPGDDATFVALAAGVKRVIVNTGGGDNGAAVAIARAMQAQHMTILVLQRNRCRSACFMLFASAAKRQIFASSVIGVHRSCDNQPNGACIDSRRTSAKIAAILLRWHAPRRVVDEMMSTAPGDIHDLSRDELRATGAVVMPEGFFVIL